MSLQILSIIFLSFSNLFLLYCLYKEPKKNITVDYNRLSAELVELASFNKYLLEKWTESVEHNKQLHIQLLQRKE